MCDSTQGSLCPSPMGIHQGVWTQCRGGICMARGGIKLVHGLTKSTLNTNETGPLPLCTFSVMGLSMCSSIFSESSPVRSKSGIINELSGFPNSVPIVRCSYTSSSWHGHTVPVMHITFAL